MSEAVLGIKPFSENVAKQVIVIKGDIMVMQAIYPPTPNVVTAVD